MPRARAHAAARIDGAECTRALQVRRRWRRRSAQRGATGAECGASACGLTPRRRQRQRRRRRRRRRRRKLLVLDTVVTRRCRVRFCVPRRGGAPSGASVHRSDAAGVSTAATTGTVARKRRRIPRRWSSTSSSTGGADSPGCVRGVRSRRPRFRTRFAFAADRPWVHEFRGGVFERDAPLWLCRRRRLGCRPGCVCAAGFPVPRPPSARRRLSLIAF